MIKNILFFLAAFILLQHSYAQDRPNVILILADDLGAGDLHVTGHPYAKTPHLDNLADEGVRFEQAYVSAGWCAPSRYSLMSGQYPAKYFYDTHDMKADEPTITKVLHDAGYATAHIGKWHMTDKKRKDISLADFGIDEYFITNGPHKGHTWTPQQKKDEYLRAKSTDLYVDMAIDFMDKNTKESSDKPFFMNLWIYPTHSYIHPTPEQLAVYKDLKVDYNDFSEHQQEFLKFVAEHGDIDKAMQAYCADLTAMDKALGRLFDYLKKNNLEENTIIIFSSDNGPGPLTKQVKTKQIVKRYKQKPDLINNVGSAKNFKERKLSLHEGGIHIPYIVKWKGHFPEGKVDDKTVISGVDFLPTITSLCKAEVPKEFVSYMDGNDVSKAFKGKSIKKRAPLFWKEQKASVILKGNMKGYLNQGGKFEVYDLSKDPSEDNDLSTTHKKESNELKKELTTWLSEVE